MTLKIYTKTDINIITFGIGFDIETKTFAIAFVYWTFVIQEVKQIKQIEVIEPQTL